MGKKKTLKTSKCSFYLQRKSPTDVYAFIKLTDLLCLPALLAEPPLCFCSEIWEKQTRRGFLGGLLWAVRRNRLVVAESWVKWWEMSGCTGAEMGSAL